MKLIVLVLLLPILTTCRLGKSFDKEVKKHLENSDFDAVAKYISDDFVAHFPGFVPKNLGKSDFLKRLRGSFGRRLFDGRRCEHNLPGGNRSISYSSFGTSQVYILRPNAALNAGYELIKYEKRPDRGFCIGK